jgi:GTPase
MNMTKLEKALVLGVNLNNQPDFSESIEELKNLAIACEFEVVGKVEQNLKSINPTFYIGQGKVEDLKIQINEFRVGTLIFNNELSPSQIRNLEKELEIKILDRTSLILEIFARRAKTREAKLQVEVAQLQYLLPKIIGSHESLGRQGGGGSGTKNRGSGEKKLELDRRKIEMKISELNKELSLLDKERNAQKKMRSKSEFPCVTLVGYTNAGKSTLMNVLLDQFQKAESKKVLEKDMLFATLETSVRKISLPENKTILLSDTVGFVNHLPHDLIKAFRSTLDEVKDADLLLHVIDYSHSNYHQHIEITNETLKMIGVHDIPIIQVFNKSDLTSKTIPYIEGNNVYISSKEKIGLKELISLLTEKLFLQTIECKFLIPYEKGSIVSYLNETSYVKSVSYEANGTLMIVDCNDRDFQKYKEFLYG